MRIDQMIDFVRGARHLVYKRKKSKKKEVVLTAEHYEMLLAIEQNLMKQKV
jgi:hypothetical protein